MAVSPPLQPATPIHSALNKFKININLRYLQCKRQIFQIFTPQMQPLQRARARLPSNSRRHRVLLVYKIWRA